MIDTVVVFGVRRANSPVPVGEIQQEIGRAGRSYTRPGEAVIICPPEDEEYAERCLLESPPPVKSEMSDPASVAFHVLPWLDRVHDEESFQRWYSRTLAFQQGAGVSWSEVFAHLLRTGCVDEECEVTPFGRISMRLYYPPERLCALREKLSEAVSEGCDPTDFRVLSYILANDHIPVADVEAWELSEHKSELSSRGLSCLHGELLQSYAYYLVLSGQMVPRWIHHVCTQVRDDIGRILRALEEVASCEGLPAELVGQVRLAGVMARFKVAKEVAVVIDELGLDSRQDGMELSAMGVTGKADLADFADEIAAHGSQRLKDALKSRGMLGDLLAREWRMLNEGRLDDDE